ncbi:MAG: sulfotransferase [Phaeodactylibacter sp.]|nr:sulfotransferase [Phaeodactylibacter sp.]
MNTSEKNIILTGPPRSGTTLACYLLNKVADTVALHEPMNLRMFPDIEGGLSSIDAFFREMRQSLLADGTALAKVAGDKIPDNPFQQAEGGRRQSIVQKGRVHFDKPLSDDFYLVIKQNAHFTFLLDELLQRYPCYAVIRNPVSTIASWNTIQAPVARGNLTVLKTLKPALYEELECIPKLLDRQVRLAHELFACYLQLGEHQVIRYEQMAASGGAALSKAIPEAAALNETLESKNRNNLYSRQLLEDIKAALLSFEGAYWAFYSKTEVEHI